MPSTQTRRKRRLGQFLLGLREAAGMNHERIAGMLRKSQATISKIENGYSLCNFSELGALLAFYGATEEQSAEARAMWDASVTRAMRRTPRSRRRRQLSTAFSYVFADRSSTIRLDCLTPRLTRKSRITSP